LFLKILAVDTSTASGSIALLDGVQVMAEWTIKSAQTHNRRLLKRVNLILSELGWAFEQLEGFAVTSGPGSFTGLRIGVTTVKTLAWAAQKPFASIPSLDALAAPLGFAALPICPLIDARKSEIYFSFYQPDGTGKVQLLAPYQVDSPERIVAKIQGPTIFCGDGWPMCEELFMKELGDWAVRAPASFHVIRAGVVGDLARNRFQEQQGEDPLTCMPSYIRPSEAEIKKVAF
jgi:tRNA threonylcarbamoyladenosine biosynthesis protein TsaB